MKAENVEIAKENMKCILEELIRRKPRDVFDSRKGIYDYDFYTSLEIEKEE